MTYIIERVQLYSRGEWITTSLLVEDEKILAVKPSFSKFRYMKMVAENFLMTPTHVFFTDQLPHGINHEEYKRFFINHYLFKGCTVLLVALHVNHHGALFEEIERAKEFLKQSPLDYTFVVKLPVEQLTVQFIRKTKRMKIPALLVEFNDVKELYRIPWGWIREALFPYNSPLVPAPSNNHPEQDTLLTSWGKILSREKIPHIKHPILEKQPISMDVLTKIGIYPKKGYLHPGGELSYNLYWSSSMKKNHDDGEQVIDEKNLVITVHKGQLVRVMKKVYWKESFGEELIVDRPSFFK